MYKAANISADGKYRYALVRRWSDARMVAFLMFNPSTADGETDDATIRKCIGFAKRWGYGGIIVINLFAYRSRDPKVFKSMDYKTAVGPANDQVISSVCDSVAHVVCAWGCAQHNVDTEKRVREVTRLILDTVDGETRMSCLGYRKDGHPKHPLMLSYDTPRIRFQIGGPK